MRWDADTAIGGQEQSFPSTRQTLLEATRSPLPNDALDRVAAIYWKPVYGFLRRKFGLGNDDAKDLTQSFFASALERELFRRFDPDKASFRTYLRMAVERFAANQYEAANRQKRGGGVKFEALEEQAVATMSPDEQFERDWRRQLFALAVDDLRAECESSGKLVQVAIFEAYDLAEGERPSYAELARRHDIPETSVTNYLAWARRRLRALVTERLRGVTSGERELREEIRGIWS
jgi:RNA polymerase sigma-70 factor (ECF subfamily)